MSGKRAHVFYSGDVQGVGFRLSAMRIASGLGLSGWVRNLGDGRVEVVCEGKDQSINLFLEKIVSMFKIYIRDTVIELSPATGEYEGFDILSD